MIFDWLKGRADRENEPPARQNEPRIVELREITFPWQPDGEITANLAIGSLRESLLTWLKSERGVHAETLMVVIGAIAGFAGQNAVWQTVGKLGRPVPQLERDKPPPADGSFLFVLSGSGERFYVGELLNGYLVPEAGAGAGNKYPLWNFVAAAAVEAGVPLSNLPDYREMFQHVAKTIGTGAFGVPRTEPNHRPHLHPRQALELFWPSVKFILSRTDGPGPAKGNSVAPEYWPIVVALVARQFLTMTKDTLDPRLSLALIMESAIAMSKVDPKTIPQTLPVRP